MASQREQLDDSCVEAKAKGNMVAIVAAKVKARVRASGCLAS